ncbi:MAG TPA: class I SAM-dependent methyltransferase [Planctomycetota bacterium]|nr:class I SAM-dependent methyltransferase [Planctomycetota bacterium]
MAREEMREPLRERVTEVLRRLETDVSLVAESMQSWSTPYLRLQEPRYLDTVTFMDRHALGGKVLEVGSAPGYFTVVLAELGYDVTGVDMDPERFRAFIDKHGLNIVKADVETERLPFDDDTFDTVLFAEIIEHLRINPLHALREACRVLKPQGRILVTTPNISPVDRIMFVFGRDYQEDPATGFSRLEQLGHMGHVRLYSAGEVERFLECTGFINARRAYAGPWRGGWKGRILRSFDPRRERWRAFLFVTAEKPGPDRDGREETG